MMSKVYNGATGAQAPDANECIEDMPGASYIWAPVIGSMIEVGQRSFLIASFS